MTILITGIHGFVGSNLVKALKGNHTIYGLDIIFPEKDGVSRTYSWNDLNSLPQVDVIIHLAGKAHDTKNQTDAQIYFDINTGLTQKIYDWFSKSDATKFIFFSSVKAAAEQVERDFLTEDIIPTPKGPYGESKIAAENYILSNKCKSTYILRPCMIHGPGNKGNLNLLYNIIKKGIPWPLGAFKNKRSFTSIDNLSYIIGELIDKNIVDGIYNIADDQSLSTNELISIICETTNKATRIININENIVRFIAKVGTNFHLPLNEERLQKLTENYVVSNEKIKKALGITNMPMCTQVGLKKTLESFKEVLS